MTLAEALEKKIKFLRKPHWNPVARLEMPPYLDDGCHGPWCYLHDIEFTGDVPEVARIPVLVSEADDQRDDWIEADPPKDTICMTIPSGIL